MPPSSPTTSSQEMRCLSAMKAPRAAECRRCSIPRRRYPPTRSWARPSLSLQTAVFPARPRARLSGMFRRRRPKAGPIALVEEGDLIQIDIPARVLAIVGVRGERKTPEEMDGILKERRAAWQPRPLRYQSGVLKIYSEHAVGPMKGGYMK